MVDQVVKAVRMNMNIEDVENRVWSLIREYANALRVAEYVNIIEEKQEIAMNYVLRKLKPSRLYQRMLDIKTWTKNETFHIKNFNLFVRKVAKQTDELQTERRRAPVIF